MSLEWFTELQQQPVEKRRRVAFVVAAVITVVIAGVVVSVSVFLLPSEPSSRTSGSATSVLQQFSKDMHKATKEAGAVDTQFFPEKHVTTTRPASLQQRRRALEKREAGTNTDPVERRNNGTPTADNGVSQ